MTLTIEKATEIAKRNAARDIDLYTIEAALIADSYEVAKIEDPEAQSVYLIAVDRNGIPFGCQCEFYKHHETCKHCEMVAELRRQEDLQADAMAQEIGEPEDLYAKL